MGGADEVTHAHLTASYTMSRDQMGRCDWPQHMTHGRVTAQQMGDKVQIVRVMTHGRVTDISEK